ncbi:MAG: Trk system potassium transport protein TrkA [Cyclobacteriaceae bacterium]|nr:MAG: Trk system potassium transport protein TrkA [Cyclobacteriaceae bacterium]
MRIIIAGAGEVGFHLAKLLAYEKQDIVLIDTDKDKLTQVANSMDVAVIAGNATYFSVLEEAQVSKANLVLAVTSSEETNLATAIISKQLGAKQTVARVSNIEFLLKKEKALLKQMGIDELISPESLAAREIKRLLKETAITDTFDFDYGLLSLIGINVDEGSALHNKSISELSHLNPDQNFITVAILRNNETIIPRGSTEFHLNDHAYFIAEPNGIEHVLSFTSKERRNIKNVMVLGGSKIGFHTARKLSIKYNVKLIEKDKEKCFELADKLPGTLILNADGSDVDLLKSEGLAEMDAFIAVTGNSESNIISCLLAKNQGVPKTIALVENIEYIHLSQNVGVDTMINKKLIAANFIFRYIRQGEVLDLTSIHGVDAEILEYEVTESSRISERELKDVDFPKSAIVGGVIRDGQGFTTMGGFQFKPKDRVVVLSKPECISKVERLFK